MKKTSEARRESANANRDSISGEPGSHPVGTGLGEALDPTVETEYRRSTHSTRPYDRADRTFEDLALAYRIWREQAAAAEPDESFGEVEDDLERTWPEARGKSTP